MSLATKQDLKELVSVKELTETLGVDRETVYRWVGRGCYGRKLEAIWIGGKMYFTPAAIEAFRLPSNVPPAA